MRRLFSLGISVLLVGCSSPPASIKLEFNRQVLGTCEAAEIEELKDGQNPGGFRLICRNPSWGVAFNYDTRDLKDNRIKEIWFNPPLEEALKQGQILGFQGKLTPWTFKAAVFSSLLGKIDCASAKSLKREGGETPIPRSFRGGLIPGTYLLELAEPCGQLLLTVS